MPALPAVLVFIEPDFGTALVYLASLVCVLFVAGVRLRHLALLGGIAVILAVAVLWALPAGGVEVLKPYQVDRLTSFLHPDRNTLAEGYNQSQAKIAVGSGGLVGRGKSGATQTLNDFLPERRTDFVFAVLGEERGFVGAMLLLGLYLVILWRVLRAVAVARTLYARLICAGVFGWLLASIFISVGMTIGIAPVTGIPLPLLSAGGSSTITVLAAIGVVQGIQLRARLPQRLLPETARSGRRSVSPSRSSRRAVRHPPHRRYCEFLMTILHAVPAAAARLERARRAPVGATLNGADARPHPDFYLAPRALFGVRAAAGYGDIHDSRQTHADQRRPARGAGCDRRRRQAL